MRRLGVVVVLALAAFAVALMSFEDAAWEACVGEAPSREGYSAELVEPVRVGDEMLTLRIAHRGRPVTGAPACLSVQPVGGSRAPVGAPAREIAPGRYEVSLSFGTAGRWAGTVLLAEEGGSTPSAAVPIRFEVVP